MDYDVENKHAFSYVGRFRLGLKVSSCLVELQELTDIDPLNVATMGVVEPAANYISRRVLGRVG